MIKIDTTYIQTTRSLDKEDISETDKMVEEFVAGCIACIMINEVIEYFGSIETAEIALQIINNGRYTN